MNLHRIRAKPKPKPARTSYKRSSRSVFYRDNVYRRRVRVVHVARRCANPVRKLGEVWSR